MISITKGFQFSLFFHFVVVACGLFVIPSPEKIKRVEFKNQMTIYLSGVRKGANAKFSNVMTKPLVSEKRSNVSITNTKFQNNKNKLGGDEEGSGPGTSGLAADGQAVDFLASVQSFTEPVYPKSALKRGIQGAIKVKIFINIDGLPDDIQILQSSGHKILDEAALVAIKKWVFKKGGGPLYYVVKTIVFQINASQETTPV